MNLGQVFKLRQIDGLYKLLKNDLTDVEGEIKRVLRENALASSLEFINYVLESQGKLLRPILVLLSAYSHDSAKNKALYYNNLIKVAAAIEIIHMASLLHDDVIDEAKERRGKPSLNAKYDNGAAVTMGVLLYSAGLQLLAETKNNDVLSTLSKSVREMCEGELLQYNIRTNLAYTEQDYYQVIYAKTGTLFKAACLSGALISETSSTQIKALENFSIATGNAFQLSDDYLDIFGDKKSLDKELGQDYLQGQLTLPMIYALESLTANQKEQLIEQIKTKDSAGLTLLKQTISHSNVKDRVYNTIKQHNQHAHQALSSFEDNAYVNGLHFLADYILERVSG
jgi:geranylgeranyl pyrophosphate synthase